MRTNAEQTTEAEITLPIEAAPSEIDCVVESTGYEIYTGKSLSVSR